MKKLMMVVTFSIIVGLLVGCSFIEETFDKRLIVSESSPDNNFTVSLYQVGEPQWSFGDVKAKLVLYDSGSRVIDEVSFELANDGGHVQATNIIEIVWLDNQVEVRMREFDTIREYTYILKYDE